MSVPRRIAGLNGMGMTEPVPEVGRRDGGRMSDSLANGAKMVQLTPVQMNFGIGRVVLNENEDIVRLVIREIQRGFAGVSLGLNTAQRHAFHDGLHDDRKGAVPQLGKGKGLHGGVPFRYGLCSPDTIRITHCADLSTTILVLRF